MKKNLQFLLFVFLAMSIKNANSQSVKINVEPAKAQLYFNSNRVSSPFKMKTGDLRLGTVAVMSGYATQGLNASDVTEKEYTFKLLKADKLPAGTNSRKIELAKLVDNTGKLRSAVISVVAFGGYASVSGADLSDVKYSKTVSSTLTEWGYKSVGQNAVFSGKSDVAELALGGEVTWFTKETHGPGYQVSIIVHWSVFNNSKDNVVYETTTAGFSDSEKKLGFGDEFALALKDALIGVMIDPKFKEIAIKKGDSDSITKQSLISITPPKLKKFSNYGEVVKASVNSVVTVKTNFGHGSGFVISENGYILTNKHVVVGAEKIEVIFDNGFSFEAKEIRLSEERDVAIIKIPGSGFKPLALNTTDESSSVGTEVIAIGTPEDIKLGQSVTKGIVSGKREFNDKNYLQTDVAINAGNSGGPLINTATGEVIGIIAAKIKATGIEGLGFGIPIGEAVKALDIIFE